MILHWGQLPIAYGGAVAGHRTHFEEASQTTYAMLCCRPTAGMDGLETSGGEHAERTLLASALWTREIQHALRRASALDRSRLVVTLAVNHPPCPTCTDALEGALRELRWRHPRRFQRARFILACRGAPPCAGPGGGRYEDVATTGMLRRLREAGWELCVLQTAPTLAPGGRALLQALERLHGTAARPTRLES